MYLRNPFAQRTDKAFAAIVRRKTFDWNQIEWNYQGARRCWVAVMGVCIRRFVLQWVCPARVSFYLSNCVWNNFVCGLRCPTNAAYPAPAENIQLIKKNNTWRTINLRFFAAGSLFIDVPDRRRSSLLSSFTLMWILEWGVKPVMKPPLSMSGLFFMVEILKAISELFPLLVKTIGPVY